MLLEKADTKTQHPAGNHAWVREVTVDIPGLTRHHCDITVTVIPQALATHKHRATVQHLLVTTVAITVAWAIGQSLSEVDALVAAIIAAITLRGSVQGSVGEAFIQILGTAIGIAIAFASLAGLGDTIMAVPVTVLAAIVSARLLNLGEAGALSILITALIVVGPGLPGNTAIDRAWGTLIGVAVALVFSFWTHPLTPVGRTNQAISKLAQDTSNLLDEIAQGVAGPYTQEQASRWLEEARALDLDAENIRAQATEATRYASWSPLASASEAQRAYHRFVAVEHTTVQVRTIARSFYDAALKGTHLPQNAQEPVVEALAQASATVQAVGAGGARAERLEQANQLREHAKEAAEVIAEHAEPDQVLLGASVVSNISRIAETLQDRPAAITDVSSPGTEPNPLEAAAVVIGQRAKSARSTLKYRNGKARKKQSAPVGRKARNWRGRQGTTAKTHGRPKGK